MHATGSLRVPASFCSLAAFKTRQFVCPLDTTGGRQRVGYIPARLSPPSLFSLSVLFSLFLSISLSLHRPSWIAGLIVLFLLHLLLHLLASDVAAGGAQVSARIRPGCASERASKHVVTNINP